MADPVWRGPYVDGVTQTLLSKFEVCAHRFWLQTVLGLKDKTDRFPYWLHYGDAFHNALDVYQFGSKSVDAGLRKIKDYFHVLKDKYPANVYEIGHWAKVCTEQFKVYCSVYQKQDSEYEVLFTEKVFKVPYTLPSGRVVYLRGKFDGGLQCGEKQKSFYLSEHKVYGDIDETGLQGTLDQNLQVDFYYITLLQVQEQLQIPTPEGVLYNVIRRPLGGGKFSITKRKGRKTKKGIVGAETDTQFYNRLSEIISENPDWFFYRWKFSMSDERIAAFRNRSFDRMLERLCDWWDSIADDPFDPWRSRLHYQRPFGIHDSLSDGKRGDYWDYLTSGRKDTMVKVTTVFPELE